jgi:two-component system, sensor histidine kinase PdtaS
MVKPARALTIATALEKSEERFRQVVEAAPNAMVMIGQGGVIEMVNAQAELVFGYPRAEMLGRPVEMLAPERYRGHHPKLRGAFFDAPVSRPMGAGRDLYGLRKDGTEFPVEIGLNPIETDEGPMVLSAIVDISERKQREEGMRAALTEKEVLLAEIHHRVKNNLQIIHSLLSLQASKVKDEAVLKLLLESQNRIQSMALIHQTLYESKNFALVNIAAFLDTLVPSLVSAYSVDPDRIRLTVRSAEVSVPIHAAIPCGLIVNELISNALKHAFPAERVGRILVELADDGDDVTLQVSDDGVGIPADWDFAASPSLGLQLVHLLSDQLGGELAIHRADPTRFSLRFKGR